MSVVRCVYFGEHILSVDSLNFLVSIQDGDTAVDVARAHNYTSLLIPLTTKEVRNCNDLHLHQAEVAIKSILIINDVQELAIFDVCTYIMFAFNK